MREIRDNKDNEKILCARVEKLLKQYPKRAYIIQGIMIDGLGVRQSDMPSGFGNWAKSRMDIYTGISLATIYSKVRRCLYRLVDEGKVKVRKHVS